MLTYKEKINRNFSGKAKNYDRRAIFQKDIGRLLLARLERERPRASHILDLGTGTGFLLEKISELYPESKICGLDIASGMVEVAKGKFENKNNISIVQGDMDFPPFSPLSFDLILSNLSLQWCKDLSATFKEINTILKSSGSIYASILGGETFHELKTSLISLGIQYPLHFVNKETLSQILRKTGFTFQIESRTFYRYYPDLLTFLKRLKDIGAGNVFPVRTHLGQRHFLKSLEEYYIKHFTANKGLKATYEVISIKAKKVNGYMS